MIVALVAGLGLVEKYRSKRMTQALPTPTVSPATLLISKLSIEAPIIPNVPGLDDTSYLKALENGVAHYDGTPLPGSKGNSVIFGHSDYYKKQPGNYKQVFKSLNKLKKGDQFEILKSNDRLRYEVIRSEVVADDDLSVLNPSDNEQVTLLTCWPPGTIDKRYVVVGKRLDKPISSMSN